MKYGIDTYELYRDEIFAPFSIRVKVTMKEEADLDILRKSVNTAITRYPYLAVKVKVDEDGAYVLEPNDRDVVVIRTASKPLGLGSDKINGHLLYVDCDGRDIYFNISHALCGGGGAFPWVMTNIYQYVKDKYNVEPYAPGIKKPGTELLENECFEPTLSMLSTDEPIFECKSKQPVQLLIEYMNGLFNPFKRYDNYYVLSFSQKDVMNFAKDNDASVVSFFMVAMAKALDKVLPEKDRVIGIETAHNVVKELGIPNCHSDLLSHIYVDYERDELKWDMNKLGTMTRGQIILQSDYSIISQTLRRKFELYDRIDNIKGLKNKRAYMKKNNPSTGKDARHGTSIVNYTGRMEWGEVANYVDSYVAIVGGHTLCEVSSLDDRIFLSVMQLIRETKYVDSLGRVMTELGIPYTIEGPFPKNLPKHKI